MTSPIGTSRNVRPVLQIRSHWFTGTLEGAPMMTSEAAATLADYPVGATMEVTIVDRRIERMEQQS